MMKRRLLLWLIFITLAAIVYVIVAPFYNSFFKKEAPLPLGYHYSYFSDKSFYDNAFAAAPKPSITIPKNSIGLTINHHLLAPEIMAGTIETIATTSPLTVVIISPNHNSLGKGEILTSEYDWQTPYGTIEHNSDVIQSLLISKLASVDEKPFETEHGISAIVAFVKKALPNAKIVPLIIKDSLSEEKSLQLSGVLNSILPDSSLVIASLDFSHYLPNYVSDFHDVKSIEVLQNFDLKSIAALDIDSKPTLYTFLHYLELRKAKKTALLFHTNANQITGTIGSFDNTSYIDMVFAKGQATSTAPKVTLLAFGDMMLDRYVRYNMNLYGFLYPFKKSLRFLDGSDIVLANLEGPVTHFPSVTLDLKNQKLQFTFDPKAMPTVKSVGFTLLGLANNHTMNFGQVGFDETKKSLHDAGLNYFGDPFNKKEISTIETIRGMKIAFVGYHEFNNADVTPIVKEIERLKSEADFIVVSPHWGVEYKTSMTAGQIKKAHAFIDAGADLVLGAHPHVIEPIELYKNKIIFYSLGNFIFDQDFSVETMHGLGVGVVIEPHKVTYSLFPLNLLKTQVSLADEKTRQKILETLKKTAVVPEAMKDDIIKGTISIETYE